MTDRRLLALRKTRIRLKEKVGYSQRERHIPTASQVVSGILLVRAGTVDADFDSPENLEDDIVTLGQYLAFHYAMEDNDDHIFIRAPNRKQRHASLRRHSKWMMAGCTGLRDIFLKDHLLPLYLVPRNSELHVKAVLTLFGDYQVNADETAAQIEAKLCDDSMESLARSAGQKMHLLTGSRQTFEDRLVAYARQIASENLPDPKIPLTEQEMLELANLDLEGLTEL